MKAEVRERDGHRCTKCGMTNDEHKARFGRGLDVHRTTPGSVYTVDDCVTVCRPCHRKKPKRTRGQPDLAKGNETPLTQFRFDSETLDRLDWYKEHMGLSNRAEALRSLIRRVARDEGYTSPPAKK